MKEDLSVPFSSIFLPDFRQITLEKLGGFPFLDCLCHLCLRAMDLNQGHDRIHGPVSFFHILGYPKSRISTKKRHFMVGLSRLLIFYALCLVLIFDSYIVIKRVSSLSFAISLAPASSVIFPSRYHFNFPSISGIAPSCFFIRIGIPHFVQGIQCAFILS